MQWSDIQFSPTDRTLRQFAGIWLVVFGLLSAVEMAVRHRPQHALAYVIIALTVGPLGLLRPRMVRPVFVGWSVLAFPIGWLVSTTILALLFYGIFTPMALVFRLAGRDVLTRRHSDVQTYWKPKPAARGMRDYFRQS
jgi:hypothetical protein